MTLSLAESCTGGLVSKLITDIPGSSAFYKYGIVAYSNDAKLQFLGVKPETLSAHGAVSRETAEEMTEGVRKAGSTDIGIGITGIAGPQRQYIKARRSDLHFLSAEGYSVTKEFRTSFSGDVRTENRNFAANEALKMLSEFLEQL